MILVVNIVNFIPIVVELVSSINDPGKKCGGIGLQHRGPLKSPTLPMNTIKLALIVQ